jgi:phage terminase large subunit-like protein
VDRRELEIRAAAILELRKREAARALLHNQYAGFYDWQQAFCAATADYFESCLCAANQIGKTYLGTSIDAFHLLGDYPEDWQGHRFEFPPLCWALGYSMEKTRDLLQTAIFGAFRPGRGFAGGLVPADRITSWESATGTPNAMRTVRVRHASGGEAEIQFWSYSQGQHALMGDVVDWFHVDEEPKDQTIRPQVLTRTINGDKGRGGRGIYTFTPENGRTDLVIKFMDDPSPDQFFMMKGWDDAPHMTPEKRERLLAQYPEHQRKMRSQGVPMLGHGRIFDLSDEVVLCDPFEIPDHWMLINGMDFGYDHPQAHAQLAIDRDSDTIYVIHSWKRAKVSANDAWGAVQTWAKGVPTAWPHDGLQHEKGRDVTAQQKNHYATAGFRMLPEFAQWPGGGLSVETGIYEMNDRFRKGTLKIFTGQQDLMDEFRQYHRDEGGKIVKLRDDILSAVRYAYMMRRFAKPKGELNSAPRFIPPAPRGAYHSKTMSRR